MPTTPCNVYGTLWMYAEICYFISFQMKQEGHQLILLIFLKNKVQPGTKESRYKGDEENKHNCTNAFAQTQPSFFQLPLHALRLICPLSKMTSFLVSQMTQQAVIKISLKILLPKASLASITISNGYKFRFQLIEIKFQQLSLTERTLSLFLHVRYGIEHSL